MDWSEPVDLYCERTDASFWSGPVNALTNAAFLITAVLALRLWRRGDRQDWPALALLIASSKATSQPPCQFSCQSKSRASVRLG
jgi:hypothetical protein